MDCDVKAVVKLRAILDMAYIENLLKFPQVRVNSSFLIKHYFCKADFMYLFFMYHFMYLIFVFMFMLSRSVLTAIFQVNLG